MVAEFITDKDHVKKVLYERIFHRRSFPHYTSESASDNAANWLVLSREEFVSIVKKAQADRANNERVKAGLNGSRFETT